MTPPAVAGVDPASGNPSRPIGRPRILDAFGIDWRGEEGLQKMARYQVLILHNLPLTRQYLPEFKRRHPHVLALMYRELYCVLSDADDEHEQSVGQYDWIDAHHPEWFQLDAHGRRVEIPDYPGRWMMDLGNAEWQAFWIERTLRDVVDNGWDGAYADDVLTTVRAHHLPPLAGYPDDASLQAAVTGFLARAYPVFQAAGKRFMINASETYRYPGLYDRWLDVTDGILEEHFAGRGWTWGDEVAERQIAAMQRAAAREKWAMCMTYGAWDDRERMTTSLAAYLVAAGPKSAWLFRPPSEGSWPVWQEAWEVDLGAPLEEAVAEGDVRRRRFEGGEAVVNLGRQPQTIRTAAGELTLPPKSGRILQAQPGAVRPRMPSSAVPAPAPSHAVQPEGAR
jgi:hypothetical protein